MKKKNDIQKKFESFYGARTVCGEDGGAFEYISSLLNGHCDNIYRDSIGNIIAERKCADENAKTVALVAVCDDFGFAVTKASDEKSLLHPVGIKGAALSRLSGRCGSTLSGAQGFVISEGDTFSFESDEKVFEGDFVYAEDAPVFMGDSTVYLCGLAAKVFSVCLTDIASREGDFPCNIKLVFCSSHLLGSRGCTAAAYSVDADEVIAFDLVLANTVKVGEGPVISFGDSGGACSREMVSAVKDAADEIGIKVQNCAEVKKERPSVILPFIANGCKTSLIGIACEMADEGIYKCDIKDILGCEAIACAYLIFGENGETTNEDK